MYDSSSPFTSEEINEIEKSGLTIAELRDFYQRFPDQNLDVAIAGCLTEKKDKSEGLTPGLEADRTANPDAPAPAEVGHQAMSGGAELEKTVSPETTV